MRRYIPTPRQYAEAITNTVHMLGLKWRMLSQGRGQAIIVIVGIFVCIAVFASSFVGQVIVRVASQPSESAARQLAYNYLMSYIRGEIGTLGASALALAILSSLLAPFTGVISQSLFSPKHIAPMQASLLTRFTDSFVAQLFSSISLLQLIAITSISSLVTLEGGQSWGILYTWISWPILIALSVCAAWGVEVMTRTLNRRQGIVITVILGSIIGLLALFKRESLVTFFGLGNYYIDTIRNITGYSVEEKVLAFAVLVAVFIGIIFVGSVLSLIALSRPITGDSKGTNLEITDAPLSKRKPQKIYEVELFFIMVSQMLRSPDTLRPVIIIILGGIPVLFFFQGTQAVTTTFIIAIPLIVACSWGVNFLGVMGGGSTWLANQPRALNNLPWIAALTQASMTLLLFFIIWTPVTLRGSLTWEDIGVYAMTAISVTVLITRSSMAKSLHSPYPTHPGVKGETLVPPGKMLAYTARMTLWGSQYGIILLYSDIIQLQTAMCFFAVLWSAFRMHRLNEKWNDPQFRSHAIQATHQA